MKRFNKLHLFGWNFPRVRSRPMDFWNVRGKITDKSKILCKSTCLFLNIPTVALFIVDYIIILIFSNGFGITVHNFDTDVQMNIKFTKWPISLQIVRGLARWQGALVVLLCTSTISVMNFMWNCIIVVL